MVGMATQTKTQAKIQPLMNYGFAFLQEEARLPGISSWPEFTM